MTLSQLGRKKFIEKFIDEAESLWPVGIRNFFGEFEYTVTIEHNSTDGMVINGIQSPGFEQWEQVRAWVVETLEYIDRLNDVMSTLEIAAQWECSKRTFNDVFCPEDN